MPKYFVPGERLFPVQVEDMVRGKKYVVLRKNNKMYLRQRWWGKIEFVSDPFKKASRWKTINEALAWARGKGLA